MEVGALAAGELLRTPPSESTASIRAGAATVQLTHVAEAVQYRRALKATH